MGWIAHIIVDVALGVGLLIAGAHGKGADYYVLDAAGGYLLVVSLLSVPRSRRPRLPRLVHRVLDGAVALLLLASPLLIWGLHLHLDVFATAMALAIGVIVARGALVTSHRALPPRGRRATQREPIEAFAREAPSRPARPAASDLSTAARRLGRLSGEAAAKLPDTARRAGYLTGRVKRAGRAARRAGESES